jgi:DNA-binding MarR family transcriptional regulator/GNAT superfamily N-acetyltransferase
MEEARVDADQVRQLRGFNRAVTQRVGALNDAFLSRDRPLGQARLLWEIGPGGDDVRDLRARLDLDSGYLSRLLRSLEADGLITVQPGGTDARVRTARLTSAGQAERAVLDQRSDELAASILAPLSSRQRDRLITAMAEVEQLLTASAIEVHRRDPQHPHVRWCLQSYFAELAERTGGTFDVAHVLPVRDAELLPPAGLMLIASLRGEPVGCGAVKFPGGPAEIKRMWVAPRARGLGLGRRLLSELEARAAERASVLRLETNGALREAIGMYRAAGFREVPAFNDEPNAHHWFEKTLADRSERRRTARQPGAGGCAGLPESGPPESGLLSQDC